MAKLTPKQEKFCLEFIQCGNAAEAYRRAYNTERMKPESIWVNSSKLMADANVAQRVAELRNQAAQKAMVTLESHLADLARLRDLAEEDGQFSAAITAEISRGKAVGLYTERLKQEVSGPNGGAVQTSSEIVVRFVEADHGD
jgi:phage terminase small subunit